MCRVSSLCLALAEHSNDSNGTFQWSSHVISKTYEVRLLIPYILQMKRLRLRKVAHRESVFEQFNCELYALLLQTKLQGSK